MAAAAAATQLPPELWNKVLVEYCDASNRTVGRLAQTCTALRNTMLEDEGIWRTLFHRRFYDQSVVLEDMENRNDDTDVNFELKVQPVVVPGESQLNQQEHQIFQQYLDKRDPSAADSYRPRARSCMTSPAEQNALVPLRPASATASSSTSRNIFSTTMTRGARTNGSSNAISSNIWRKRYVALHDLERRFRKGLFDRKIQLTAEPTPVCDVHLTPGTRDVSIALGSGEILSMRGKEILSRQTAPSPAVRCFVDRVSGTLFAGLQSGEIMIGGQIFAKAHLGKVCGLEQVINTVASIGGGGPASPLSVRASSSSPSDALISPSTNLLFSCSSSDDCVKLWDIQHGKRNEAIAAYRHESVTTLSAVSAYEVWSGGNDRMLNRWDTRVIGTTGPVQSFGPADDWVMMVEAGGQSGNLVRAADKAIHLWDARYGTKPLLTTHKHKKLITRFHSMMTRRTHAPRLVSCSLDGRVKISSLDRYRDDALELDLGPAGVDDSRSTTREGRGSDLLDRSASGLDEDSLHMISSTRRTSSAFNDSFSSDELVVREGRTLSTGSWEESFRSPDAQYSYLEADLSKAMPIVHDAEATTLPCSNDYCLCVDFDDTKLLVGGVDGSLFEYNFEKTFDLDNCGGGRAMKSRKLFRTVKKSRSKEVLSQEVVENKGRAEEKQGEEHNSHYNFSSDADATASTREGGFTSTSSSSGTRILSSSTTAAPVVRSIGHKQDHHAQTLFSPKSRNNGFSSSRSSADSSTAPDQHLQGHERGESKQQEGHQHFRPMKLQSRRGAQDEVNDFGEDGDEAEDEPLARQKPKPQQLSVRQRTRTSSSRGSSKGLSTNAGADATAQMKKKQKTKQETTTGNKTKRNSRGRSIRSDEELFSSKEDADSSSSDSDDGNVERLEEKIPSSEFLYGLARQQHLKELGHRLMSIETVASINSVEQQQSGAVLRTTSSSYTHQSLPVGMPTTQRQERVHSTSMSPELVVSRSRMTSTGVENEAGSRARSTCWHMSSHGATSADLEESPEL
ncbi:unnamed protein product [Amoebophrya sp. A120]|nr:unnamed protein product [Amoebophrya sp. A120]|eukprot:GSA120T00012429001.1